MHTTNNTSNRLHCMPAPMYVVVVIVVSHIHAHWLPTREKLLYTVVNPARGLLNRKKKKSGSAPSPPPPRALLVRRKIRNKKNTRRIHMSRRYESRRYAGGLGPSRVRTRIPTTRRLGQWVSLRKILRSMVCPMYGFIYNQDNILHY